MPFFSKLTHLNSYLFLLIAVAAAVIPQEAHNSDIICSPEDTSDCYPAEFIPTFDWQVIREGQVIPPGLDVRLDWQTGVKSAKIGDPADSGKVVVNDVVVHDIVETEEGKVVNYDNLQDIDDADDEEINALKMAVQKSEAKMELDDALNFISSGMYTDQAQLIDSLDSLTEHSHSLNDGVTISEPAVMNQLLTLAFSNQYSNKIKELSLRVIAQSLRHNPEAVLNVDFTQVLPSLLSNIASQSDAILQKRLLGVVSSLIQNENNAKEFITSNGRETLLNTFPRLQSDSKIRSLEILDDLSSHGLLKRDSDSEFSGALFKTVQDTLSGGSVEDDNTLETVFDKLVQMKKDDRSLKTDPKFLEWLAQEVETRKLSKRDEADEELHKKLLEARHAVFGNPMAMRKANYDEF
ncbi:Nucleotide exchange factor SIL1 [Cyberlindnera fabianii]|uniref:Nucleotide exchange factor SIL1 n=1 Tax=Cyberlindnera fabianii TaxID=36022 RepID=A0A1V2L7E9_CYBFA|nr:Nucleotide exchange factor SIL1 [Cyberlindnera fabianii]